MFRDQIINLLEAAVVFLRVANALSLAATTYASQLLNGVAGAKRPPGIIGGKLNALRWTGAGADEAIIRPLPAELHCMRGPGPKWHEKHGASQANRRGAIGNAF